MKDLLEMNVSELDSETLRKTNGGLSFGISGVTILFFRLAKEVADFLGNDGPGTEVE